MSRIRAFTLIELLIVIAIIAILGSATVLVLNPLELMRQGRDGTRINDTENIEKAVKLTLFGNPALIDSLSPTNIYLSLPSGSCPTNPPTGYSYVCNASAANITKIDGTGWIPLNLQNIASLPIDPNASNNNFYYAFVADPLTKTYVITSLLESEKQLKNAAIRSGGYDPSRFEKGNVSLWDKANGLQGYWNFDGTGAIANGQTTGLQDSSGNGNNGTATNTNGTGMSFVTGKVGNAVQFDGVDDCITVANSTSVSPNIMTTSVWIKTTNNAANQRFVSKTEGGSYQLSINENGACGSNTLCFVAWIAGGYRAATTANTDLINNTWHNAVGTFDGSTIRLYLDGSLVGNYAQAGTISTLSTPLCLGTEAGPTICNGGGFLNGYMDDVRIYNRALSADEIRSIYNSQK